jgi:hypothetical protein
MRNEQITIEGLELGQSLLTQVRGVKNNRENATYNKVQIEVAEKVVSTERNTPQNYLLQALNKSDERFQGGNNDRARRGWIVAEPQDFVEMFGSQLGLTQEEVDAIMNIGLNQIIPLGHLNPQIGGKTLRIQVIETTEPDEYEKENLAHRAKQNGRGLYCVTKDKKQLIFSHTQIVDFKPQHVFIPFDLVPFEEAFKPGTSAQQMSVTGKVYDANTGSVDIINKSIPVSNPELEQRAKDMMGAQPPRADAAQQRDETEEALAAGVPSQDLNRQGNQGAPQRATRQSGGAQRLEGQGGYDVPGNPPGHEGGESSDASRTSQNFDV